MPSRELPFPVFDADNHMYEPQEALTKFLPGHDARILVNSSDSGTQNITFQFNTEMS